VSFITRPKGKTFLACTDAATMGLLTRGGTVFNAATTDWARVLAGRCDPVVVGVTRNVLNRLG
jgi:hypothetical protein